MKTVILAVSLGLILFAEVAGAQTGEKTIPKCQQLAYDFAENPDSLIGDRLNQLQWCMNHPWASRNPTNPPTMLKGTTNPKPPASSKTSIPSVPKKSDIQTQSSEPLSAPKDLRIVPEE